MNAPLMAGCTDATRQDIAPLSGFMDKRGEHFRAAFKRRWFCLDGDELRWSESPSSTAKGSVSIVDDFSVRISQHPDAACGEIELVTASRTLRLRCENTETAERWIHGLSHAATSTKSACVSEAVPPEPDFQPPAKVCSYLSLVRSSPRSDGVWPPRRPLATALEAAQRRLAFGVSLCASPQVTGDRIGARDGILERVDVDVLASTGNQLAKLGLISPLEQTLQALGLDQEATIVAKHLEGLGVDSCLRAQMEMLGAVWMKQDSTKGAFKGKWEALINEVAAARGLMTQLELGQIVVRRDADEGVWGVGYVTQLEPVRVNSAALGRNSPGYEWDEVRAIPAIEDEQPAFKGFEVGEQVLFGDGALLGVGIVAQIEPHLQVTSSPSDATSVCTMREDVRKIPPRCLGTESLFLELNRRMQFFPTTSALLKAAQRADAQLIQTLALGGVDLDGFDYNAETALHCLAGAAQVAQPHHYAAVAALLDAGASVELKVQRTGQTALMRAGAVVGTRTSLPFEKERANTALLARNSCST